MRVEGGLQAILLSSNPQHCCALHAALGGL
jgi:hypothetical protein